jgi:hypothetical protein
LNKTFLLLSFAAFTGHYEDIISESDPAPIGHQSQTFQIELNN